MPRKNKINWERIRWGTLTAWLKTHRAEIKRKHGDPFTKTGELNDRVLRKLYKDDKLLKKLAGSKWKRIKRKLHFKIHVLGD